MIQITIYQGHEKEYKRFRCIGHSGYSESGSDIICAAVSILVINTMNSIEEFTSTKLQVKADEDTGLIDCRLVGSIDHDTELLIRTMILGLQGIQEDYGNDYIILNFKEV